MYTYDLYGEKYDINIMRSTYRDNNNTAVIAELSNGEPFAVFTVNLDDDLPENMAYLDTNNVRGVLEFMIENNLAEDTGKTGTSGFCTYPLVRLNLDKIPKIEWYQLR